MIETVTGPVPASELGRTMMHEHLTPRGGAAEGREPFHPVQTLAVMELELQRLGGHGVGTIVDVTPFGKGRDPALLRELSLRTGINIVAATGFYKEPACPDFAHRAGVDELRDFLLREIEAGIDGSGIRPGIIKVGTSKAKVTPTEHRILVAAARAHLASGLPITTHTTLGTMGRDQIDILQAEGVDPSRVIVGHSDLNREIGYHLEILKTGATLGFDTIGKETFRYRRHEQAGYERYAYLLEEYHVPDSDRLATLSELVSRGYASQLVLSSDLLWAEGPDNPGTTGTWGYSYLWERFLPRLRLAGVDEAAIQAMTVANPAALLRPGADARGTDTAGGGTSE